MEKWLRESLTRCLQFDVPDDMIKYILSIKTYQEFDEYFDTLLNKDCEEHRQFLVNCKQRLFNKNATKRESIGGTAKDTTNKFKQQPINNDSSGAHGKTPTHTNSQGAKKKTRYVNLYSNDGKVAGDVILLKGRRVCHCEASEHNLINNCLSCGRIVCEQEGSGPCLYCGEIVCSEEEKQALKNATGKKKDNLLKSLQEKGGGESLRKALEQRDRLLEYDRNSEKRTTVIDDELDYFDENSVWQSEEQRAKFQELQEQLHEEKHGSRVKRKITVDFAGRVVENAEANAFRQFEEKIINEVNEINRNNNDDRWSQGQSGKKFTMNIAEGDQDLNLELKQRPRYWPTPEEKARYKNQLATNEIQNDGLERTYNRVKDKQLMEMQDMRQCISLHQPWASLLVAGIKKYIQIYFNINI